MANIVEEIQVPSGHTVRKIIRCARKGTIGSCRLVQWDDEKSHYDGFKFSFWAAKEACKPGLMANDAEGHPDDWDRVQYAIGKPKEVEKGEDEAKKDGEPDTKADWTYKNMDNGGSQTNMMRQIYLELTDNGPVDKDKIKTYKLYLEVEPKSE